MKCPRCGNRVGDKLLFCPRCGFKLKQISSPPPDYARPADGGHASAGAPKSSGCLLSLSVLLVAALLLLAVGGLGIAGVRCGVNDREKTEQQAAAEHYEKGVAYLTQGEFELAIAEMEAVVQLDPENGQALAKLAQAREKLQVRPTATPVLLQEILAAYLDELRTAHAGGEWQEMFELADRLLATDPTYHRSEVDQMLFDGFYESGLQLVEQDRLREAVRLLDRALALQPNNADVQRAEHLATLYLTAMGYWSADWVTTIETLESLYRLAPNYKDVRERTHLAHVSYGDLLAQRQDWCGAEQQYTRALEVVASPSVAQKRQDAASLCSAFPTRPTEEATSTPSGENPTAAPTGESQSGVFIGRLVERTETEASHMFVRGQVLDREDKGVQDVQVQIKAWDWSAIAVTNGNGQYSFDGLSNTVTYTLSLLEMASSPVDIAGTWGEIAWVDFEEAK